MESVFPVTDKSKPESLVANALTIITSYGLRSGMDVGDAIKGLIVHGCHKAPVVDGDETILSCVDAIGKAIRIHTGLVPERGAGQQSLI